MPLIQSAIDFGSFALINTPPNPITLSIRFVCSKIQIGSRNSVNFRQRLYIFVKRMAAMAMTKNQILTDSQQDTDTLTANESGCSLIVWNDEVNTFEWVIETLIEICGHSPEQAEQCSYFIHYKGKYAVKQGEYDELKPMCDAITERGIGATVEVIAE